MLEIAGREHAHISCRNSLGKIAYVVERLGEQRLPELFAGILEPDTLVSSRYQYLGEPLTLAFFKDINNWYSNEINLQIFDNMTAMGIDAFRTGYFTVTSAKQVQNLATIAYLQLLGPVGIIKRLNSINQIYNRTKTMALLESSATRARLRFSYHPHCRHNAQVTRQNIGVAVALMELAGFKRINYQVERDDFGDANHTLVSLHWQPLSGWYRLRWLFGKFMGRLCCQTYLKSDDVIAEYHRELVSSFEREMAEKEQQKAKSEHYYRQLIEQQEHKEQELTRLVKLKTVELQQSLSDKQRLFENFSHELKTPLTLIIGPLEQALKQDWPQEWLQLLQGANSNAHRLFELVNSLLELAEIQINRDKRVATAIGPCTGVIVSSLQSLADQHEANISLTLACDSDLTLLLQAQTWELMLTNLLTNAIKHGEPGTVIRITVCQVADALQLQVADNNRPIPTQQQVEIFSRFSASESRNRGNGLGLAIVKELAENHQGKVELLTSVEGNCFRVTLPLSLRGEPATAISSAQASAPRPFTANAVALSPDKDNKRPRVLLVEDNLELAAFLIAVFSPHLSLQHSVNGRDALALLEEETVELILSDVMMPVMDGYELCRQVKADPLLKHIPLLLLTAKSDLESQKLGLSLSADDYIAKPFNTDILLQKIHNVIHTNRALAMALQRKITASPSALALPMDGTVGEDEKAMFLNRVQAQLQRLFSHSEVKAAEIAAELFMSEKTLNRKLKLMLGCSVSELLSEYRLSRAAESLAQGHSIKEVCFACGFNSLSYFSRSFKQKFALTPSQYAAQLCVAAPTSVCASSTE